MQNRHLALPLGFIIAVGPVSVDMYLPAFSLIAQRFGAAAPQLTLAAYFAGFASGQLAQGLLSDRFGRRLPLAAGLLIYTIASIGCACALDTTVFCVFRAVAAFGAAASIVVPRAMVRDVSDGKTAAELMSNVMQVMSVAPIIAPLLGSLVLLVAGWRMIFVVAAVYGLAGLAVLLRYLPETLAPERRIAPGVVPAMRLYGSILREWGFLSNASIGAFGMCALFAYLAAAPAIFMTQYGYRQWGFGLILAILGAASVLCFRLNALLVRRYGAPRMIGAGVMIWLAAGLFLLCFALGLLPGPIPVVFALLVFGLGYSFIPSNAQVAALGRHRDHAATATALMSTMQYCAGAAAGGLIGQFPDHAASAMACIMVVCATAAGIAALLRPRGAGI